MPNKKNKNSRYTGFYWYMQEIMPRLKKDGRVYGGIDAVVPVARPMWKGLSKQEQDRYEKIAKEMKRKEQNDLFGLPKYRDDSQRLDNVGNIIADRVDASEAQKETRAKDRKWAKGKWPLDPEGMMDLKLYFVGFEYLCMLEEGDYLPCEVALLEWNMSKGVIKTFHKFIDTGGIPMGYRFTCQQHSEETHQIPIERFDQAENNYREMWLQMENFVNPSGEAKDFPPLYCAETDWKACQSMLDWLHAQACIPRGNCLNNVFVLEDCVQDLAAAASRNISDGSAANILLTSVYDYEANTRCKWHEEQEVKHCALGTVKRYAYSMGDFFSGDELYNFTLTKNHLPIKDSKYDQNICSIPASRVYMEPANKTFGGNNCGSAWKPDARKRQEEEEYNGIFPARDIRYKQEKIIIDPNEDDEDDEDLESMYSYSSKQTSLSNFSVDQYRPYKNNPYYKPNIVDEEEFPSLGGAVKPKKISHSAMPQITREESLPNEQTNSIHSWQPSAAYLEERSKREEEISNKPSLMDIVRQRDIEEQTNPNPQVRLLPGGIRIPETAPGVGRGRGNVKAAPGKNPWLQQPSQGVWGEKTSANNQPSTWSQGAKRGNAETVQQKTPMSFTGVGRGRGRGTWVPRAEPDVGNKVNSNLGESQPVTRPPPGFGRGFMHQQMSNMNINS